jgi:outer membrane protein assembly factor BamB
MKKAATSAFAPLCLLALVFALTACGSSDKDGAKPVTGKRIAVMEPAAQAVADSSLSGFAVEVPEPSVNTIWALNGGNAQHSMGNLALSSLVPSKKWSTSIGAGSSGDYKLLSTPVVSGKVIYAQDAKGRVSAYDTANGDRYWRVETASKNQDGDAMGGGLAVDGAVVYVTTGFGEVLALRATDGAVIWRRSLGKPIRSAPTIAEGRV